MKYIKKYYDYNKKPFLLKLLEDYMPIYDTAAFLRALKGSPGDGDV